jgi:hypothetical protein
VFLDRTPNELKDGTFRPAPLPVLVPQVMIQKAFGRLPTDGNAGKMAWCHGVRLLTAILVPQRESRPRLIPGVRSFPPSGSGIGTP